MESSPSYLDPSLSPEERTELLLGEMTLAEKIGQMCQYVGEPSRSAVDNVDEVASYELAMEDKADLIRNGLVGSFLKVPGWHQANTLQKLAEASRLKIPLLIATDAIHGHGMDLPMATIFPSAIGIASAFDPDLAERIATVTAREMRATGFHWTFSPNLDVVRDPRWGRTGETFGEDPLLVGELGVAMVRGYQGKDGSRETHVMACGKHMVGGGVAENGLNGAPADVSLRTLEEVFYPPFRAAVEAGVCTIMPAHNEVNGVPCHADRGMLTDRLRGEWGFTGFVVSDWNDIERLHSVHRVARSRKEADCIAVLAGIGMHMHGKEFHENIHSLVLGGSIPARLVDEAARKILEAKFRLGLFEHRYVDATRVKETVLRPAHVALALEASRKSIVLLKNDGHLLPLAAPDTIFVTGPDADDQSILGDWARVQPAANVLTILQGIRRLAPAATQIDYLPCGSAASISAETTLEAGRRAEKADIIILILGENSLRENPERTSGENLDRASLELPGKQPDLVRAILATGKPTVIVLVNGAPISSDWMHDRASAILEAWEPGMMGGTAVAEVLFGQCNPSGRLPITVPRSAGHLRCYYSQRPSAYRRGGLGLGSSEPRFPFGHGMSYTSFAYVGLRMQGSIAPGEPLAMEVEIENKGPRPGEEIVLVYVEDLCASVTRPAKELKAFRRVFLNPGESQTVRFVLEPDAFSLLDGEMKRTIEPGEFRVIVGQEAITARFRIDEPGPTVG